MLSELKVDGNAVTTALSYTLTNVQKDTTITASFSPISYTISYDLDGGTASNLTSYTIETESFTLNNPTKDGYTFTGWTGSNGTTAQTEVTIATGSTGDRNYTANWESLTIYTLTYNARGGSGAPASQTYVSGESITISTVTPTYDGYTFNGWYTGTGGSGYKYEPSTTYSLTSDLTLYAYWYCDGTASCRTNIEKTETCSVCNGSPSFCGRQVVWRTVREYDREACPLCTAAGVTLTVRWYEYAVSCKNHTNNAYVQVCSGEAGGVAEDCHFAYLGFDSSRESAIVTRNTCIHRVCLGCGGAGTLTTYYCSAHKIYGTYNSGHCAHGCTSAHSF